MYSMKSIVPSLPAHSFEELESLLAKLRGVASGFQVDIVDGVFAPNVSWPFTETDVVAALGKLSSYTSDFEIEVDCMCMNPILYQDAFVDAHVARVIIHAGSTEDYTRSIEHARKHSYRIGLGILNTTPEAIQDALIPQFDFVQVMGIEHIGAQGQPFDERTLETVERLKIKFPELEIAVDGSVNEKTIPRLRDVGVHRFAPGSAISKAEDPAHAFRALKELARI
jgi:ribulose-phosphate 3-epimerase